MENTVLNAKNYCFTFEPKVRKNGSCLANMLDFSNVLGDCTKVFAKGAELTGYKELAQQFSACRLPFTVCALPGGWDRLSAACHKITDKNASLQDLIEGVQNSASFTGMSLVSMELFGKKAPGPVLTALFTTSDVASMGLNGTKTVGMKKILKEAREFKVSDEVIQGLENEKNQYLSKTAKSVCSVFSTVIGLFKQTFPAAAVVALLFSFFSVAYSLQAAYLKEINPYSVTVTPIANKLNI